MKVILKLFIIGLFVVLNHLGSYATAQTDEVSSLHAEHANKGYEAALINVIDAIQKQDLASALQQVNTHLTSFPKSREGHLLRADILHAMSGALSGLGEHKAIAAEDLKKFKHQLNNRLKHTGAHADKTHSHVPANLVALGQHKHVMVADMTNGRLYLYKNNDGVPELIRDYYLTIGSEGYGKEVEGDNRTPVGIYEINRYIEGKALPDLYGKGAFPINYPNRYDRFLKRTGYGIWLHGTPSITYARSPWASEGCFVLSNDDLIDIGQYISVEERTPVVLSDRIEWVDQQAFLERKNQYMAVIEKWKQDWESLDISAYLQHYSADNFNFGKDNYQRWAKRKLTVNRAKTFVQLDFDIKRSEKEQYWQKDNNGQWKIIYEG